MMRLALIFDAQRPGATGTYLERACRTLGVSCDHWWLRDAGRIPPGYDLYLRVDHGDDYLVRLPNQLRPSVFYAIDTHLPHSWRKIQRTAGWYDFVCCAQGRHARRLANGVWLPLACDLQVHRPAGTVVTRDIAFVGTSGGSPRKFYLQALRERYPNSFIGETDYTRMGELYGSARIGFNYAIGDDVNMRVFEVLAAQTLLLTNALSHDELSRLGFRDREHLVYYRDPSEVYDVIDYYLGHPEEREAIARSGAALVQQRHTYVHRVQQLLASAAERLGLATAAPAAEPS